MVLASMTVNSVSASVALLLRCSDGSHFGDASLVDLAVFGVGEFRVRQFFADFDAAAVELGDPFRHRDGVFAVVVCAPGEGARDDEGGGGDDGELAWTAC